MLPSHRFCTNIFERLLDKFSRFGLPDSIAKVFDKRPYRSSSKQNWRLYDNNACIKTWFRKNAIKLYNKTGYFIRTETTYNNPKSLGLKKPACYLQAYLWHGLGCNTRFLNSCADVEVSSIPDGEDELFTKTEMSPHLISGKNDKLLCAKNCLNPNTRLMALKLLTLHRPCPPFSEILHKFATK